MEYLHETSVGDLLKVIDAIGQVMKTKPEPGKKSKLLSIGNNSLRNSQYKGSITSQANKLVMTFPVLCSNTVTPSTASMISKAIERKCTLMLHQIFTADTLVAGANTGGIQHQINGVYTGIDFDTLSVDDMIRITDRLNGKQASFFESTDIAREMNELSKKVVNSKVYESSINDYSVSKFMISNGAVKEDPEMIITEAPKTMSKEDLSQSKVNDIIDKYLNGIDLNKTPDKEIIDTVIKINKDIRDRLGFDLDVERTKQLIANAEIQNKKTQAEIDKIMDDIDNNTKRINIEIEKNRREREKAERDKAEHNLRTKNMADTSKTAKMDQFKKALMDTDVKKVNELVPSMLIVNYAIDTGDGNVVESSGIVGVKTRLIAIDSFQILDKLASKNRDKSGLVKLIKATTGEIKFMKDFILAIDKAKIDALSKSKRGSANPIWRVLERRAAMNNLRKALGQKNDASPITTLVVTQEEVDYLRKTSGMELDNVNTANYILNSFNLMGLCIVDETTEVAKFLFDGEFNQFDTYAFNTLEREASGDGGMYKKVINLMAKRV